MGRKSVVVVGESPNYLVEVLPCHGADVTSFQLGASCIRHCETSRPHVVVTDLHLADISPGALVPHLASAAIPVVVMTAKNDLRTLVACLGAGADDYITTPVDNRLVLARLRNITRTARRDRPAAVEQFRFARLAIDNLAKVVECDGTAVKLTPREFELLVCLARHEGQPVGRADLLREVWSSDPAYSASSTVNEHVRRLRLKLGDRADSPELIETVPGGYMLHGAGRSSALPPG